MRGTSPLSIVGTDVRALNRIIGGYHGHLSYAGGMDTLEVGMSILLSDATTSTAH